MNPIPICYNDNLYKKGICKYICWDPHKQAHMAVSGGTGSGKTVFTKVILYSIVRNVPNALIYCLDFKGDTDFSFLDGYKHYYRFDAVKTGFDDFYHELENRQKALGTVNRPVFTLFDEWFSFLNFLEKKESEAYKQKLANILMLGRSFDMHLILSQQRLDAESFGKSRDNFGNFIALGNISREAAQMIFSNFKDEIEPNRERSTGYMLVDGSRFYSIRVPFVRDMEGFNGRLREMMTGCLPLQADEGKGEGEAEREPKPDA
ncbi:MAG: DUF87 domain-containing protein [Lachnospiraceae bacterium]|nr:DUF87 domain-containing protein [Lachnospiraceae bacterium]